MQPAKNAATTKKKKAASKKNKNKNPKTTTNNLYMIERFYHEHCAMQSSWRKNKNATTYNYYKLV